MAEIIQSKNNAKGTRTKFSPRVDLTPMVDLGFLLITFFVFTTSIAAPKAMKLILPDDSVDGISTPVSADKTLTLILDANNNIFYYKGFLNSNLLKTNYSSAGLRTVITGMMNEVEHRFRNRKLTTVIIKPTAEASYKNVVDALDEMLINDVTRYVVTEPEQSDLEDIHK